MKDERLGDVEEWVRGNGLDDSLLVQYNMDSVTALKQPLTTTVPLFAATATQKKGDGKGCDDDEGTTKKYVVGPNYHSHPKMNVSTPVNVKVREALVSILKRGFTIDATLNDVMDMPNDTSDDDDDETYCEDQQTDGGEYILFCGMQLSQLCM